VVPPVLHGFADIGATIALIAAPFVLRYRDHGIATAFSIVVGAGGLAATLLTRFESDLEPAPSVAIAPAAPFPVPSTRRPATRSPSHRR
jgi:hypothetical protein